MNTGIRRSGIALIPCAEPLTAGADPEIDDDSNWAQCEAYVALRSQIQRYAQGRIMGQSTLLAGHRGSGKTTLVHLAIQQVRWLAEGKAKPAIVLVKLWGKWQNNQLVMSGEGRDTNGDAVWLGENIKVVHNGTSLRFNPKGTPLALWFPEKTEVEITLRKGVGARLRDFLALSRNDQPNPNDLEKFLDGDLEIGFAGHSWRFKIHLQADWSGKMQQFEITQTDAFPSAADLDRAQLEATGTALPETPIAPATPESTSVQDKPGARAAEVSPTPPGTLHVTGALRFSVRDRFAAIPVLVPLHGPDLFLTKTDSVNDEGVMLAEAAMSQIRKSAHRALAEEIGKRFSEHAAQSGDVDLMEAATQLRSDLDETPQIGVLRTYWDKAGILNVGLLSKFRRTSGSVFRDRRSYFAQGLREILALATATEAVRPTKAPVPNTHPTVQQEANGAHLTDGFAMHLKSSTGAQDAVRIAAPILSLLAGAFAANAVVDLLGPITSGAIGVATVLLAYSFLRRTLPSRPDPTLTGDSSLGSQDLLLPLLVDRMIEAGFAPIFVVDELDKIQGDLDDKLSTLMTRLKYFVTDRAFFCFIADRSYYERFQMQVRREAYPVQDTYYADRLLVYHKPADFQRFLARALVSPAEGRVAKCNWELRSRLVQSYAEAHIGALTRLLRENSEAFMAADRLPLWHVPGYRLAILIQVAIECVFEDPAVQLRLRQEPHFTQALNDVLYHIPRQWRQDKSKLSYLLGALSEFSPPSPHDQDTLTISDIVNRRLRNPQNANTGGRVPDNLDIRDQDFLWDQMERVARFLEKPHELTFRVLYPASGLESRWPRAVQLMVLQALPLLRYTNNKNLTTLEWLFDQYGKSFENQAQFVAGSDRWLKAISDTADPDNTRPDPLFAARFALLGRLEQFLKKLGLAEGLKWVQAAILEAPKGERAFPYDEQHRIVEQWDASQWESAIPKGSTFHDMVDSFDQIRRGLKPLLAFESLIYRGFPTVYWKLKRLAVAKSTGAQEAKIVVDEYKVEFTNDYIDKLRRLL